MKKSPVVSLKRIEDIINEIHSCHGTVPLIRITVNPDGGVWAETSGTVLHDSTGRNYKYPFVSVMSREELDEKLK